MQQIATFDITFDDGIAIDGKIQGLGGKLRARVLSIWERLQQVLVAPIDGARGSGQHGIAGYYGGACERVHAAVPVRSPRVAA